jgi:anaerobic selenocysteine-containing dehydrogenase
MSTAAAHPSVSSTPIELGGNDLATACVLCSHNCGLRVDVADGRITDVRADPTNPFTQGYICNKGVTITNYIDHPLRVEHPLRRRDDGSFEQIDWDTAITEIAGRLRNLRDTHGPGSLGLSGVGGQGNHMDAPYATGFLRAFGTRKWFNAYAQEKTQHHLVDSWIFDASPAAFMHADVDNTAFMVVMGTNPKISHRGHRALDTFKALEKKESCTVVVLDPRETETTRGADRHLQVRPGSDAQLLLGMAASIVQNELFDAEFLRSTTTGFNEIRDALGPINVAEMASRAGIEAAELEQLARDFATAPSASFFFDLGVEQTPYSTLVSYLIRILACITGNFGNPGGMHFIESFLPATRSANRKAEPARALASGIPAIRALGNFGMFSPTLAPEEILVDHPDRIRALIVEGGNPLLSYSDTGKWREAVAALDLLVVIDPAMSETAREADYVLPVPCGYEKWEVANFPRRHPQIEVQVRPPVVPAPPDTRPEPEIYTRLLEEMGLVEPLPNELNEMACGEDPIAERAAFFARALELVAGPASRGMDAETQIVSWAYRSVGRHLPAPSLVAVWALCQANAMQRRDAVLRTLGDDWSDKTPGELGEEIFRRILDHPEGVEIACLDETANLVDHIGHDDGRAHLAVPEMLEEIQRAVTNGMPSDPEYPMILGNGLRTRWTANTIQRDPNWRKGRGPHCALSLSPGDAERLDITDGETVRLSTRRASVELPATVDKRLQNGHVAIPNGFGMQHENDNGELETVGVNMNLLSDAADRDPFTGCPHHRFQPCQIAKIA